MSFFNDFFSSGNGVTKVADPFEASRNSLQSWLLSQIGKPGPQYQGEKVAPMSDAENKSMDFLNEYGNSNLGSTFGLAKNEISKTLTDQYDPTTSTYYQAVKAEAERAANKNNELIASNAAGGGRYYSGARLKQQREALTDTTNRLNTTMGELAMRERQNKLNVIPQALQIAQEEQLQPLKKTAAFQQYGALPRELQQLLDNANLIEFYKSNYDYPMAIAGLTNSQALNPLYQQNQVGQFWQLLNSAAEGAGKAASSSAGGGK